MTMERLFVLGKLLLITFILGTSLVAQMVKNLPSMQETQVRSLDQWDLFLCFEEYCLFAVELLSDVVL